jgi:hypothetical protein
VAAGDEQFSGHWTSTFRVVLIVSWTAAACR